MYADLLKDAKEQYYSSRIRECDDKQLFSEIDKITKPSTKALLPTFVNSSQMADRFVSHSNNKVDNLLGTLGSATTDFNSLEHTTSHHLLRFLPTSSRSVGEILSKCKTKTCSLDPIPSYVLKVAR